MKNNTQNFYIISLGFILILLGGITHILTSWLFWYPFGLITIPFVTAWINLMKTKIQSEQTKEVKTQ